MSKTSVIVSLVFTILALVATTVAFSTYWYYMNIESSGGSEGTITTKTYFKYNGAMITMDMDGMEQSMESLYPKSYKMENKNQIAIFNASLAFDVLAWITLLVASVILVLQVIGKLEMVPIPMISMIGKFILCASVVFCMISMFVFLGLPRSKGQDCRNQNIMSDDQAVVDLICGSDVYTKFVGSMTEGAAASSTNTAEVTIKWGPSTSFIAIVIGTGFSLIACFNTIFTGVFVNQTPGN